MTTCPTPQTTRHADDRATPDQRRVILVGDADTIPLLQAQLGLLRGGPVAAGFVSLEGTPDCPLESIPLDALVEAKRRLGADLAIVSLPSDAYEGRQHASDAIRAAGLEERFVPPLAELVGRSTRVQLRNPLDAIDPASLTGRIARPVDEARIASIIRGRTVLITGAGGSIGSELARRAADFGPARIVLLERSENALFEIDRRLGRRLPAIERRAILHDVVDRERTRRILAQERPDVVFHAAAHKHVPLMEDHPAHAIANNFQGTRSIVDAALASGASHFVLISTDKAVQPTSVMGATKRLAEFYVHMRAAPGTRFAIVRFGNVIGSAGSVLPIWAQQIAEGGPLTITDERMTRYFMTIPEAASLVMQAASMATDDPAVFVLDMGEPIRIADLARRLVRSCGCVPVDRRATPDSGEVEIAVTGIRPGEKLHESLSYEEEHLLPTDHPSIRVHRDAMLRLPDFASLAADLESLGPDSSRSRVLEVLTRHVPGARLGQQDPGGDKAE